jgi:hypothetical protein
MNGVFGYEKSCGLSNKLHTQALLYYTQNYCEVNGVTSQIKEQRLRIKEKLGLVIALVFKLADLKTSQRARIFTNTKGLLK